MRKILLLLFLPVSILSSYADSVSRQTAQQTASRFFAARGKMLTTTNVATYSLLGNATEDYAPYYVFNADGGDGFVIVSGNTLTRQILAYSDTGTFDEDNLDDNIRSWMNTYAYGVEWVATHEELFATTDITSSVQTYASSVRHVIAPLLTCTWNQGAPYNNLCPTYYEGSKTGTSVTGCTATAFAQVMYFHKYPAATKSTIPSHTVTYTSSSLGTITTTVPAVPAGTKIDWDNMLDSYDGNYTAEQAQAVAELNLYVGQSVKMGWGSSSGASFTYGKEMFEDYFGYDKGVQWVHTVDYEIDQWQDMIYGELADGYPVALCGWDTSGAGHAFVLDGYDGEGYFHVNWGWGGSSNGYFCLTVLHYSDSSRSDITASVNGYSYSEQAMLYVRSGGKDVVEDAMNNLTTTSASVAQKINVRAIYKNETGAVNSYDCAVVMRDYNGDYIPVGEIVTEEDWADNASKSMMFDMSACFAEPGEYRLSPASRVAGTDTWYPYWTLNIDDYILATVDDDLNVSLALHKNSEDVSITNWDFEGNLLARSKQTVIITFENNGGEYKNNEVGLYTIAPGASAMSGVLASQTNVGVRGGGVAKAEFYFTPDAVGEWTLYVFDGSTTLGQTTVEITSTSQNWPLELTAVSVDNDSYGSRLTGSVTIKNNSDDTFNGKVKVLLSRLISSGVASSSTNIVVPLTDLAAGRTQIVAFSFTGLQIGQSYFISVQNNATSSNITNGGINFSSPYVLKEGVLQWTNDGQVSGSAMSSTLEPSTSVAGVLCEGLAPTMITPSKNANAIYAFTAGASLAEGLDGCNVVEGTAAEKITFANNGYGAYIPVTFTAGEVSYCHTFATASDDGITGWEALTLPFKPAGARIDGVEASIKHDDDSGDFYMKEFTYEDDWGNAIFEDVDALSSLWANTPYVIAATPQMAGKTVEFYATDVMLADTESAAYVASTDDFFYYGTTIRVRTSGIYVLNKEGYAYEYKSGTTSVSPFENYFITTLPEDQRPEKINITYVPTGIRSVESAATAGNSVCYDLQGRRITAPTKGVYLLNGKKYVK